MQCVNNFTNGTFCNGKLITELDYRRIYELAQSNIVKFEAQFSTSTSLLFFVPFSFQNSSLLSIEWTRSSVFTTRRVNILKWSCSMRKQLTMRCSQPDIFFDECQTQSNAVKKCNKMKQHKSKSTKRIKCSLVLLFQNRKR